MGTCSYTWKELDIECHKETWGGSDEFCIFHDPSPEKSVDLFREKLKEQMESETERHDFTGYCFPANWDFSGKKFKVEADFRGATFKGTAYFGEAEFHGNAYFGEAEFQNAYFKKAKFRDANFIGATFKDAYFGEAKFQGLADFRRATFQDAYFVGAAIRDAYFSEATFRDAYFSEATFQDAYFRKATFQRLAYFRKATFQRLAYLVGATFQGTAYFSEATFRDAYFRKATFQRLADFREATFKGTADLWEATFRNVDFRELERIYRNHKQKMQRDGNYSQAGDFYYGEMEMRRKGTKAKGSLLWLEFYQRLAGYGEKPELVARNSFLVILLGAILFFFCGVARVGTELPPEENPYIIDYSLDSLTFSYTTFKDFGYCLYYSVVTFTTLGYGDIHPLGYSHIIASAEALIGVFFIALFVLVFGRKMMR